MVAKMDYDFALFGASGYAMEVMEVYLQSGGNADSACFVSLNTSTKELMGIPVLDEGDIFQNCNKPIYFNVAISDPILRSEVVLKALSKKFVPRNIVSSKASVSKNAILGTGLIILEYAKISPNSKVGNFAQLNCNSYLAHDSELGEFTTLSPGALCLGNVIVQDGVFIGAGAIIREGRKGDPRLIGSNVTIGMGSNVLRSVPTGSTFVGNPAADIRKKASAKVDTDGI